MCALLHVGHFAEQIVKGLELLLDNLGSDDGDAASEASGQDASMPARGTSATAAGRGHALQQQQQLGNQSAAAPQVSAPHARRLSAPAAFPAAAVAPAAAGGAALGAVQVVLAPAAAQTALVVPVGLPLSAHTSPSTPVHLVQVCKQRQGPYDSGLTPSGGLLSGTGDTVAAHPGQSRSGSGLQLRNSNSSCKPISGQLGAAATFAQLPSVLDENVYLQDL
jgi:hypothetical protein